jgi:hypothetical protein
VLSREGQSRSTAYKHLRPAPTESDELLATHLDGRYRRWSPCSTRKKNDFCDAEAIAKAVQCPTIKFVAAKTVDQLDPEAL